MGKVEIVTGKAAAAFEELHIYQRARELTNAIYQASRSGPFQCDFGLTDQIRRASVSIMSNIAEGFERGAKAEFVQFLFIAKGSSGEVRAQLQIAADQGYISSEEHARLADLSRRISAMISNFIAHLRQTTYEGEKFSRPARMAEAAAEKRRLALRAAQLRNMQNEPKPEPPQE